jgi:hypothetical protein
MKNSFFVGSFLFAALSAAPAVAAEITFDGYTNACFTTTSCTPGTTETVVPVVLDELSYTPGSFGGTSVGGDLSLTLGSFSLIPAGNDNYAGNIFSLRVTFELPAGLDNQDLIFSAVLTGTTSSAPGQCGGAANTPCGSVLIDFDNTPVLFSFTNGTSGSFLLAVSDVTVNAGQTNVGLAARITQANQTTTTTAPEPATLALAVMGLMGVGVRRLRRG